MLGHTVATRNSWTCSQRRCRSWCSPSLSPWSSVSSAVPASAPRALRVPFTDLHPNDPGTADDWSFDDVPKPTRNYSENRPHRRPQRDDVIAAAPAQSESTTPDSTGGHATSTGGRSPTEPAGDDATTDERLDRADALETAVQNRDDATRVDAEWIDYDAGTDRLTTTRVRRADGGRFSVETPRVPSDRTMNRPPPMPPTASTRYGTCT